jgi:hypothetical protein
MEENGTMGPDQTEQDGRLAPLPVRRLVADGSIPSELEAAHLDGRLMHELSALNYLMAQYIVRHYDAEAGRTAPTSVADELALADSVAAAGNALRARAKRRQRQADSVLPGTEES